MVFYDRFSGIPDHIPLITVDAELKVVYQATVNKFTLSFEHPHHCVSVNLEHCSVKILNRDQSTLEMKTLNDE